MSTHASALAIGHRLQEYLVGRLLGHGGFGLTYLAQDTNLNALVAIKEFLPQEFAVRSSDSQVIPKSEFDADSYRWGLDRFKEEARALARFKHPNIVRVSRLLEANGTAYMVMDFEPGMTLSQYLKRYGPTLDEGLLLGLFLPVLDGLEALHRLQLVHRDIKPSNIYVRAYGGPMLIDFGAVRQAIGAHSRNLTSLVTPGYAPIEQYSADGRQGAWSDLYAVGASLYYCMFGHAPADAARRSAAISDGAEDPFVPAAIDGATRYSTELLSCVDWALQFRVRDRPQSAHDLRERLRASPVPPQAIEVPESMEEVPELQHGVLSSPSSLPPLMAMPDSATFLPGRSAPTLTRPLGTARGATTDLLAHSKRGGYSDPEVTSVNPASESVPWQQRFAFGLRRLRARVSTAQEPAIRTPTALTTRIGMHLREPRSLRMVLSTLIVLAMAGAILAYNRRVSGDERLYAAAMSAGSASAYQQYLRDCRTCIHRADAETAMARLTQSQARPVPQASPSGTASHVAAHTRTAGEKQVTGSVKPAAHQKGAVASKNTAAPKNIAAAGEHLPQAVYAPAPKYPLEVKGGTRGWVDMEFNVNVDGSVSDIQVVVSQPSGVFDTAAEHAVHSWVFTPDTVNGVRKRKRMRMRLDFKP